MQHQPYDEAADLGGGLRALEASAGTGKTFAITSNVLRLVVERPEPFRMERLLLVTFTRAATAELEDRLRRRLVAGERALTRAEADETWEPGDVAMCSVVAHARAHGLDEARRRVEEALRTVDQATVTTIHGFCHQVLQQAAVHADSDPAVAIDTDDDRLVSTVIDDWIVRFCHDADLGLVELLAECRLGRTNLHAIGRTVAGEPDPVLTPDPPADDLDPLAEVEAAMAAVRRAVEAPDDTIAAAHEAKQQKEITGGSTWAPTDHRLLGRLANLRDELADGGRPDPKTLEGFDPAHVTSSGKVMPDRIAQTSLPQAVAGLTDARTRVETWIRRRLADDVRAELRRRREQAGTASFSDLLRHLDLALHERGDALVEEVRSQFDAVLVDEFQDTDPVQWSILSRLFTGCEVFHVVGDPKQAIYGWRGADLATYLRALGEADHTRTMTTNWRSDGPLVDAINTLLGRDEESLGGRGVDHVEVEAAHGEARLRDADGQPAAGLRITHLAELGGLTVAVARSRIAEDVAQDIVETLEARLTLPTGDDADEGDRSSAEDTDGDPRTRRIEAADCAVLVRRHKEAAAVAEALRARDVPVVVGGGDDVLLSAEAEAMADLLRVLTEAGDDRALRRLLVGPFVGLDGAELAALDDQQDRWQQYAVDARRWAATWADHGIAAAVQRAIREGEAERRHARRRDGDRTMTNLRHLTELLHRAEQEEALGTHALAAWFDARRAEAEQEMTPPERELRLERDDAAVKVMTIHAAKGLQFPLVWVPFLWTSDVRSDGVAPFVVNDPDNDHARTVALHAASTPAVREADPQRTRLRRLHERSEWEGSLRLAYVALTRAEHRCTVHLCAFDHQGSLPESPAWQLFWRRLGSGAPDADTGVPAWDEDALRRELRDLADHPHVAVTELATPRAMHPHRPPTATTPRRLDVLSWGRTEPLDVDWGRASFTGLLRGRAAPAPQEADAADEADLDQTADRHAHALAELPREVCDAEPDVPLAPLPRGAAWGTFLHDVLEHADFAATPDELGEVVRTRARWASVRLDDELRTVATGGLHAALQTPLGPALGDLRLRDVGRGDRVDELDFTLTLGAGRDASFNVGTIANVFERHDAEADTPLAEAADHLRRGGTGRPVHGLLIGSIDLALRHPDGGRFWIADYKSNGLGQWLPPTTTDGEGSEGRWAETEAHTTPERVMTAMLKGDYLLQAHLYVVALHRYLRSRLGDAYDYERHVGGWAYLFLRGMTGPDVRRTDGMPHGIATGRPTQALVEELDAVLRGRA